MPERREYTCGFCMAGDHAICKQNYKYYDVHYLCTCTSGSCADRGNGQPDSAGAVVPAEAEAASSGVVVRETTDQEPATTSGEAEGTTADRTTTTEQPKPTPNRGRPRKKVVS